MNAAALNPTEHMDRADDVIAGRAPACGEQRRLGPIAFVCIMPPHAAADRYSDKVRRRTRPTITDRHYFTEEGTS